MLAPLIIGSLGKGMSGGTSLSPSSNDNGMLMNMLDFDNDGSIMDDMAGLAMKYLF